MMHPRSFLLLAGAFSLGCASPPPVPAAPAGPDTPTAPAQAAPPAPGPPAPLPPTPLPDPNACGALVVSRHGCAPAMPTRIELDHYLANTETIPRPDRDVTIRSGAVTEVSVPG